MNSDYCDLTRKSAEFMTLLTTLGTEDYFIAVQLPGLKLIRPPSSSLAKPPIIKYRHWTEIQPDPASSAWFEFFALNETGGTRDVRLD